MHHVHHGFDIIHGCVLQNAMTEIEDMTGSAFRRRRISWTRALISGNGANNRAGSRLPCTAWS